MMHPEVVANITALEVPMDKLSLVDAMIIVMLQAMTELTMEHGIVVATLAMVGAIGILNGVLKQTSPIFELAFKLLLVTPLIMIFSIHDKNYGNVVSGEIKAISGYVKTNPAATKQITRFVISLVVFLLIAGAVAYWQAKAMLMM